MAVGRPSRRGRERIIEGIRLGVVSVSWSYGHWAYDLNTVTIDNIEITGDTRRASGV